MGADGRGGHRAPGPAADTARRAGRGGVHRGALNDGWAGTAPGPAGSARSRGVGPVPRRRPGPEERT
ncbi:hypothetical protein SGPA1_90040 [Streptomyces misionensis JCM 4497]